MKNIGYRWLEANNLQQASTLEKIFALAALEQELALPVCADNFHLVWEGNVSEEEDILREARRHILKSCSTSSLLRFLHIAPVTLTLFVSEVEV